MTAVPHRVLSIVIPVYDEEAGIAALFERLSAWLRTTPDSAEIILVDDHSTDRTPELLREGCRSHPGFRYLRLSRNCGSHVAILAGLQHARGDCAVFLAADLQDPPELVSEMLARWRAGSRIVWAVRERRDGVSRLELFFSRMFYRIVNALGDVALPPEGSDFALLDRAVIDALLKCVGAHPSLGGDIARLGFPQAEIGYVKQSRFAGTSKWTLGKKLKAFADAIVLFSYRPLRAMSYMGLIFSAVGFLYAAVVVMLRLMSSHPIEGWASLMVVVLVIGGVQMTMLGVLGEYLWRTLEEARRRPLYFVEDELEVVAAAASGASREH
jgi:dolichol-phosphate mannosyltransferase